MDISRVTEFFGWLSIINIGYLLLATLVILLMGNSVSSLHAKLFKVKKECLAEKYFDFLSHYKIFTLIFSVAPYFALKVMGD